MILLLDTEFSDIYPDMELLSLALASTDGRYEFYGERNDVPVKNCSQFALEAVLPLMTAGPPVSGDFDNLRTRLRTFLESLPETARVACDSHYDLGLFVWVVGAPWPKHVKENRINLSTWAAHPVFAQARDAYHAAGHPYHHALHDVRGMLAGYQAWVRKPK